MEVMQAYVANPQTELRCSDEKLVGDHAILRCSQQAEDRHPRDSDVLFTTPCNRAVDDHPKAVSQTIDEAPDDTHKAMTREANAAMVMANEAVQRSVRNRQPTVKHEWNNNC
eukprot:762832-Prymnesium_polylepis.2